MSSYKVLAAWSGYCAPCATERPLLLVEHGPRGLRAWWSGVGAEQRTLSYACGVCGGIEHVPATEAEDADYDATLLRWPDWSLVVLPDVVPAAPRRPVVTVASLPTQRVSVTDGPLIAA